MRDEFRRWRCSCLLLGFFGTGRHLVLLQVDLLVDNVRRWCLNRDLFVFFDDRDVRVLVLILALAFDRPIRDDGEYPEHPEEDADTAAKNEGYGSTLPATQIHQGVVEAGGERCTVDTMNTHSVMMGMAVVRRGRRGMTGICRENHIISPCLVGSRNDAVVRAILEGDVRVRVVLDEGQPEGLPECIGDINAFLAEATHATAARTTHVRRLDWRPFAAFIFLCLPCHCRNSRRKRNRVAKAHSIESVSAFRLALADGNDSDWSRSNLRYSRTSNHGCKGG